ncbi:Ig-like domain-containing protein [Aciditerrimonas ferrireducens]|uniref:Ig-like domain-containing protein n=1 Tax=Aciditerrimonas ferrireducens TaxID=667306 RepID=A0ABV6C3Y4_9ACTN
MAAHRSSRRNGHGTVKEATEDRSGVPGRTARRARRAAPLAGGLLLILGGLGLGAAPAFASGGSPVTVPAPSSQSGTVSVSASGTTGAAKLWTVPAGVSQVTFTVAGGAGGSGADASLLISASGGRGGSGEEVSGTLPVEAGEVLWLEAGGDGGNATASSTSNGILSVCTASAGTVSKPGAGGSVGTPSGSNAPSLASSVLNALAGGTGGPSEPSAGYASVDNCEPGAGGGGGAASFILAELPGQTSPQFAAIAGAGGGGGGAGSSDGNNGGSGGGWGSGQPGNGGNGGGSGSAGQGGQGGVGGSQFGGPGGGRCKTLVSTICLAPTGGGGGGGGGGYDPVTNSATNGDGGQGGAYVGVQGGGGGGAGGGFCPTSSTPPAHNPLGASCSVIGKNSGAGSVTIKYTVTTPGIALASKSGTNQVSATYDSNGTPVPLELELSVPNGSATPTGSLNLDLIDSVIPRSAIPLGSVPLGGSSKTGSSTAGSCSSSGSFQTCTWSLTVDLPSFFAPISGVFYWLYASYSGDSSLAPTGNSDEVGVQLNAPTPPPSTSPTFTVTLSAPGIVDLGQSVTVTAHVSASTGKTVTSGTVEFSESPRSSFPNFTTLTCDGKTSVPVSNGAATCTISFDVQGPVFLNASYTPPGSSSPIVGGWVLLVVTPTTTALTASTTTPLVGQAVTVTASVSSVLGPVPSGSVEFLEAPNGSGTFHPISCGSSSTVAVSNGKATCALTLSSLGTVLLQARYQPPSGTTFQASTSGTLALIAQVPPPVPTTPTPPRPTTTAVQVVSPAAPPYRPASPIGVQATVSATGSQAPSGTVTFSAVDAAGASTVLCSAVPLGAGSSGTGSTGSATASCTTSFAASGPETILASFQPASSTWEASSGTTTLVVAVVPVVRIVPATATPTVGQADQFTASVLTPGGQPITSGLVTMTASGGAGQQVLCSDQALSAAGQVTCSGTFPTVGTVVVTASYLGSGDSILPGSATTTVTVQAAPVTSAGHGGPTTSSASSPPTSISTSVGASAPATSPSANSGTSAPSTPSGSAVVVPSVHTGEPWAGPWWWVAAGSLAGAGLALVAWGARRRLVRRPG